ncbi:glycosyltransferase family 2 protein, partial [Patescibacteria group bacterium]|nr:glycosyltransferase family 2 protein [Patescibacteria group bacterium]
IIFDLYWLFKAIEIGGRLIVGYFAMKKEMQIDYFALLKNISKDQIAQKKLDWEDIYHVVLLPTYQEGKEIIKPSIDSYLEAKYPKEKIIIVLAMEERVGTELNKRGYDLQREYKDKFADFLLTIHPDGIEGEIKGKSANATWAGRKLKKYLDKRNIDYERVIVSNFDCDTRVHRQYFANISYKYLTTNRRTRKSYQPIPIYNNNIWDVPFITRTIAFSSAFWQMVEATRSYRMVNFSSQAMSMKTLVDIDFWDVRVVSEDSKQYYRAMFRYAGDHQVIPILTPVYMDAVLTDNLKDTMIAQYIQMRRWAWGVEHFPYMVVASIKDRSIGWYRKLVEIWRIFDGHFSWATGSLFVLTSGWWPFILSSQFSESPLSYYLPFWANRLLTISWIGLFVAMGISFLMLPPRPPKYGRWSVLEMLLVWIMVPINSSIFGSIPSLDAQTRLMFGKYLGFYVTEKKVKK